MSMSNEEAFRAQNSINLSLALVAAAFALMAAVLAALFAVADKIPATLSGQAIIPVSGLAILLCLASVFFGGRGISITIKSSAESTFPARYDDGHFGWQGIMGILGTLVVVVLIFLSVAISVRAGPDQRAESIMPSSAEVPQRLDRLQAEDTALLKHVERLDHQQNGLADRLRTLETRLVQGGGPAK